MIVGTFIAAALISSIFILVFFPVLFRGIIVEPLNTLLEGVRAANQGDLEIAVNVKFTDELGFLDQSFTSLILSLREKAARLELYNVQKN